MDLTFGVRKLTNLVRERYKNWCESVVIRFSKFGARSIKSGAKSRIVQTRRTLPPNYLVIALKKVPKR